MRKFAHAFFCRDEPDAERSAGLIPNPENSVVFDALQRCFHER
jgi:hypothetical protein